LATTKSEKKDTNHQYVERTVKRKEKGGRRKERRGEPAFEFKCCSFFLSKKVET
jgi:hypothetical protein